MSGRRSTSPPTLDEGFFFCVTTDTAKADEFINAQRTLLQFLRSSSVDDYYDAYDILCSGYGSYDFDYIAGRHARKSFTHYLLDLYGEDTVTQIFLFPETVEDATGKTWDEQKADWQQHMEERFAFLISGTE